MEDKLTSLEDLQLETKLNTKELREPEIKLEEMKLVQECESEIYLLIQANSKIESGQIKITETKERKKTNI